MTTTQSVSGSASATGAVNGSASVGAHQVVAVTETVSGPQQSGTRIAVGEDPPTDPIPGASIYIDLETGEVYAYMDGE